MVVETVEDISSYSPRFVRFVRVHGEAYMAAYLAHDPSTATNELQRLHREWETLPPRHDCSCYGHHCQECGRIQKSVQVLGTKVEIGRTSPVHAPMPATLLLDMRRAISVLGKRATCGAISQFLSHGTR